MGIIVPRNTPRRRCRVVVEPRSVRGGGGERRRRLARRARLVSLGRLAAGVAHDVRNYLGVAVLEMELLQESIQCGGSSREELLAEIATAAKAVRDAAASARRIHRFACPEQRLSAPEPVPLDSVLDDVAALVRPTLRKRAPTEASAIRLDIGAREAPSALAYPADLREVLVNLVLNAVDAMPQGGTITLAARPYEDLDGTTWAELEVEDTGTGMDEKTMGRLCEPFFTTKRDGSGLGLMMVAGIVRRLGGSMHVSSALGRGTTFTVRLPTAPSGR